MPEYRYDYVPGASDAPAPAGARAPRPLEGRGREGRLERVWPHLPLPITRLAAGIAYRYL